MAAVGKVYFAGLPTDMDVRALLEQFGVPTEGQIIAYEQVAEVIRCRPRSGRFKSVTDRWRNRLKREHNIYLRAKDGQFTVLDPSARVDLGSSYLRRAGRTLRRGHVVVESTDRNRLTKEERAQADHILMTTASALQAARLQARRVNPELPPPVSRPQDT